MGVPCRRCTSRRSQRRLADTATDARERRRVEARQEALRAPSARTCSGSTTRACTSRASRRCSTALANADSEALRLDAFPLADLSRSLGAVQADKHPTADQLADADVLLSAAFTAFGEQLLTGQTEAGIIRPSRGTSIRSRSASTARSHSRCAKTISPRAWCGCARRIPGTTRFACNSCVLRQLARERWDGPSSEPGEGAQGEGTTDSPTRDRRAARATTRRRVPAGFGVGDCVHGSCASNDRPRLVGACRRGGRLSGTPRHRRRRACSARRRSTR